MVDQIVCNHDGDITRRVAQLFILFTFYIVADDAQIAAIYRDFVFISSSSMRLTQGIWKKQTQTLA